jgi:UDP-N-acetylmuramate--alanine ligase
VSGALVADAVPLPADKVAFVPSWAETGAEVVRRLRDGDVLLTIGAGDITILPDEVLTLLRLRQAGVEQGDAVGAGGVEVTGVTGVRGVPGVPGATGFGR